MNSRRRRWAIGLIASVGAVVAVIALRRFPWHAAADALMHADQTVLIAATLINLTSLVFKGSSWHCLLRVLAPSRWLVVQEATVVGSAVNSVSVAGIGEGARVQFVVARDRLPVSDVLASLVWSRVVEAAALVLLILIAPLFLDVPAALHRVQIGGLVLTALAIVAAQVRGWSRVVRWLPETLRARLIPLAAMGTPRRMGLPLLLSLGNWIAQWLTFHWAIHAVHLPVSYAASFTALLVANIGGILRLTPANVGIMQASMVLALLPFGVSPEHAVAAGLALQALQVLPVLVIGAAIGGWRGLMPGGRREVAAVESAPKSELARKASTTEEQAMGHARNG